MKKISTYLFLVLCFTLNTHTSLHAEGGSFQLCGQDPVFQNCFNSSGAVAIPTGPAVVSSTINVSGASGTLGRLVLQTNITHTFGADLDITLQSPAGTIVTLTTDNGAGNDDIFNGTFWSDISVSPVTDFVYINGVAAPSLSPEEAFGAFVGEDPNGNWVLTVSDDLGGDGGSIDSWEICVNNYNVLSPTVTSFNNPNPTSIVDIATTTSTILVAGMSGTILDVNIITAITHSFGADLDITITSPLGTVVTLTTDNGAGNNDIFNGTTWDDDANPLGQVPYVTNNGLVTDHSYANGVVATPLVPEEGLAAFMGQDPNGIWTLTIEDDLSGDTGTLASWQLDITTCSALPPASDNYFADDPSTLDCLVFDYIDITTTGTLVVSGDDNGVAQTLGAPIQFYDDVYTDLAVTTNGYLSTDITDAGPDLSNDCPLPALLSSGGGSRIYPLHDELVTDVYYEYFAISPLPHPDGTAHAAHIFQWVGTYFGSVDAVDFQAIIYDNNDIIYQYNIVDDTGLSSTTGMQHESLGNSTTYACNLSNSITPGLIVGFSYGGQIVCAPPANDLCDDAIAIPFDCGEVVAIDGTNVHSLADNIPSDCNDGSPTDGGGVWYSIVGTGNTITASLCNGAGFDTEISVYNGACGAAALSCVAGDDDFCNLQSETSWLSVLGTTYYILVHGFSIQDEGNFTLFVSDGGSEPNDNVCQAIAMSYECASTVTIGGSTLCATYNQGTDDNCGDANANGGAGTVWYRVIGNGAVFTASTCSENGGSANYDTQLSVFAGSCEVFNCVDGNDDDPDATANVLCSTVSWTATAGVTYFIMVHGFGDLEGNFTLAVEYGNPVTCNATSTNVSCFGANDGTLFATASGGGLPHTFTWTGPGGPYVGQNLTGLAPGTYNLTVEDDEGCTCTDQVTITQPQPLSAVLGVVDQGDGGIHPFGYNTATITVTGGTPIYDFDWDNSGYVRYDIAYTPTGALITIYYTDNATWEVTITDSNNCRDNAGNDIVLGNDLSGSGNLLDITNYIIGAQNNSGAPNGAINITVGGGNCGGNYTYQWTGPNGFTATSQDLTGLVSGWYTVTVTCGSQNTIGWYWVGKIRRGRNKIDGAMLEATPNPFIAQTTIRFTLPHDDKINVGLYDVSGKLVANLYRGDLKADEVYEISLDGMPLSAGTYICRLTSEQGEQMTYKLMVAK